MAAPVKAAIVLTEEEKLHLTNIARLHSQKSAKDRATILLCLAEGMTIVKSVEISGTSESSVKHVKRQWLKSQNVGSERINEICCGGNGRKKNDETFRSKMNNVLQFNRQIHPNLSRYARSQAIVEMAKKEGMSISVRTVTRFLEQHEKQQLANV
jgi:hypothetical protein